MAGTRHATPSTGNKSEIAGYSKRTHRAQAQRDKVVPGGLSKMPTLIDIFCTSMGLGRRIVKELDLKLTLGMAERRNTESPSDEESWGGCQWFKSWSDPKSTSLRRLGCLLTYCTSLQLS